MARQIIVDLKPWQLLVVKHMEGWPQDFRVIERANVEMDLTWVGIRIIGNWAATVRAKQPAYAFRGDISLWLYTGETERGARHADERGHN